MAQLVIEQLPLPIVPPSLKIGRRIDKGAWGAVHEGELDGELVAVKKVHQLLKDSEDGGNTVRRFFDECVRLKDLDHPHVIKFRGAFKEAKLGPILVMERMNENLRRFLERHRGKLTIQEQIRISHEITQGVAFLHQLTPPMVHRDLNDKNVMFTFDGVAKIGDFGQSKLKQDLYLTSAHPGMLLYMPPEALDDKNCKYDESLDMFSLGVLMLEIGTQQQPMTSFVGIGSTPEIKRREKDLQKMDDANPLKPFILLCLNNDQKQRPKAAVMCTVLSSLRNNMLQTILAAENRFQRMEAEVASRDAKIRELEERCELLTAQATTYKCDFEKERSDREKAVGRLGTERQEYKLHIAELNEKQEAKLSAAKSKMDQMVTALKEDFQSTLEEKDAKICALEEEVRDLQRAADQHSWAEVASRDAKIRELEERCEQLEAQLVLCHEGISEKRGALRPHGRQTTEKEERTDQSADIGHGISALKKQRAAVETEPKRKTKKWLTMSRVPRNTDLRRPVLKKDFDTIVTNKDTEILRQMKQIQMLQEEVEILQNLLSEKCARLRAVEIEKVQMRESVCVQHQHHPELQTSLLEADSEKDNAVSEPAEVFPSKNVNNNSDTVQQGSDKEKDHTTEQFSEIQDANMQEAHKCETCGEMLPANQLQLKCAGFADCVKHVAEPAPSVARSKTLPQFTKSSYTELSTTGGRGEPGRQQVGMDEDAPGCHNPAEVMRVPGPTQRRTSPSVMIFADVPKRQSMKQGVQCSAGALGSPGTGRLMQKK